MGKLAPLVRLISALAGCIAGCLVGGGAALAQGGYPARPVTVVVPFAAGGSVDTAARIVTEKLAERLKQTIIVENVTGAAGTLGTLRAVRAPADGYTLLFAVATPINVAPVVSPSTVRYDALKDLAPVARVANSTFVMVGRRDLPAADIAALVQLAKQQPGKLNYGTDGVGGSMHLATELIKQKAGIAVQHVPYRSGPQVLTELAGGQLDLAVMPLALVRGFVKDGKVRAYGVLSRQRWDEALPGVPSLSSYEPLKDVDERSWYGVLVPAATDKAIVERLSAELSKVVAEPDVARKLADAGLMPAPLAAAAFGELIRQERQVVSGIVAAAGIKIE